MSIVIAIVMCWFWTHSLNAKAHAPDQLPRIDPNVHRQGVAPRHRLDRGDALRRGWALSGREQLGVLVEVDHRVVVRGSRAVHRCGAHPSRLGTNGVSCIVIAPVWLVVSITPDIVPCTVVPALVTLIVPDNR
jgi:hypothetical protein